MTDLSQPAPQFDLTFQSEQVETKYLGVVTINDIGTEGIEAIVLEAGGNSDTRVMQHRLLCASAVGPNGERFTMEQMAHWPARAFADRVKLIKAAARINGMAGDEVEKA
jgi:hypothetical protein